MIDRRRVFFPFLAAAAVALASSCAPNETAQTVSFVLALDAERLTSIEFRVNYSSGDFAGSTGQCKVSAAAGPPGSSMVAEVETAARTIQVSAPRRSTAEEGVRGPGTTTTTSTSSTTNSTGVPVTSTTTTTEEPPPTTTIVEVTTTLAGNLTCGDGVLDAGEECDDNNNDPGDGCDASCDLEFAFDSSVSGDPSYLTVKVVNRLGIAPGTTLAFCQFQGDVQDANFVITAVECDRFGGGICNPVTDAGVTDSTTTTTTTTTTSTTSTTRIITTTTTVP